MPVIGAGQPVVFGEVLFDTFPDGSRVLGGAPFNVAWHLQAFGCAPLFVSRIGDDEPGRQVRAAMQNWGMSTSGLQEDSLHPTGEVRVSIEHGEPAYEIVADQAYDYIDGASLPDAGSASLAYQGTLALRNHQSANALDTLLARFHPPVFLDINLRPPWWNRVAAERMLGKANWLKLNEHELAELLGPDIDVQAGAAALIQQYDLSLIIITRGEKGAGCFSASGETFNVEPESASRVVDTVGAGDAFTSVCLLGLIQAWDMQKILHRAQQFASAVVGVRGATIEDRGFYEPFISEWQK
ncbi:carbohydrate kinase [Pseudomonadota bacterium]